MPRSMTTAQLSAAFISKGLSWADREKRARTDQPKDAPPNSPTNTLSSFSFLSCDSPTPAAHLIQLPPIPSSPKRDIRPDSPPYSSSSSPIPGKAFRQFFFLF
jgi:hypothetical protein